VLVLVENVEHALALAPHLPGWPLLTGPHVCKEGLDAHHLEALGRGKESWTVQPACAVVTTTAVQAVNLNDVDVLVRADGGVGLPPIPTAGLVVPNEQGDRPLLLVDLDDRHHPQLRKWSRTRKEAYLERGWLTPGVDPTRARVQRFLANRPGEVKR
jgi:hypothetical protein